MKQQSTQEKETVYMSRKYFFPILFGCFLLATGACKGTPSEKAVERQTPPVAQVRVTTATRQQALSQNEAAGDVEASQRATIAAKVTGAIEKLPVELGSTVKRGDLLVQISAGEISARVAQAEALLQQARRNLTREKRLLQKEATAPETVKTMEDAYQIAKARYNEAKTILGYTTITAPFDGVISQKNAQAGDLATPGIPLLRLKNIQKLQVVASIPEAMALRLKTGDRLPVRIAAAEFDNEGVVSEISPSADPRTRTTTIKLNINNVTTLRPGQYARVILPGPAVNTLLVPKTAVMNYGQMERLFVVKDGRARLRLVRSGAQDNGRLEILTGLAAGEQIVIQGNDRLIDGQPVQIISK